MLKWIVGSKADHPLADIKHVRDMLTELPASDGVKSLGEITRWLESLVDVDSFKVDRLYELIDVLDTGAKNHQRKVVHDYLGMSRQQKFQENKLWTTGAQFAKALAAYENRKADLQSAMLQQESNLATIESNFKQAMLTLTSNQTLFKDGLVAKLTIEQNQGAARQKTRRG